MEYKPSNGVKVARPSAMARRLGFEARYSFSLYFFSGGNKMLDKNVADNQARLREEIKEIKEYISILEHEVNASDHVARLSENQFELIFRKLQTTANCVANAGYYWAHFTNDKELKGKLVDLELKIAYERFGGGK